MYSMYMYYISLIFNACAVWVINNEDSHIVPCTENRRLYCKQGIFFFFLKGVCGKGVNRSNLNEYSAKARCEV